MFLRILFIISGGNMEKKYKYLAVWLYSISMLSGVNLDLDDETFKEFVMGFIMNTYYKEKKILDKMFDFKMLKAGEVSVSIDYNKAAEYGQIFASNPQELIKIYDEIGTDDINKISRLAELFCYYCLEVDDMNKNMKRH